MNLDSEAYWLQRIAALDGKVVELVYKIADLRDQNHVLRNEIVKKNGRIRELEEQIVAFQKREFHTNEY